MAFAVGFLWPLATQTLVALGYLPAGWFAVALGGVIAIAFGAIAHLRRSWIWIR